MKSYRSLILLLILCIIVQSSFVFADSTTLEGATPDIDTDGSQSCVVWFRVFDNLLNDKITNGVKFFLILTSLRQDDFRTDIENVLNSDPTRKALLSKYGLNANSIYIFANYYMNGFPENIDDVKLNYVPGVNIYSDLYHDANFNYSKYMLRFHEYLNQQFRALPYQMQNVITKYDRKNAGEIVVMQGLLNIIISDYIAFETYNTESEYVEQRSLHLREEIKEPLVNELLRVSNDYPADYVGDTSVDEAEIREYIDALYGFGDVILSAIEMNLRNENLLNYATELAGQANLLVRTPYTPTQTQQLIEVTLRMNTEFIELDSSNTLTEGAINSFRLLPTVGGVSNKVVYTVADPSVVQVSETGLVTLSTAKQGFTVITATVEGYNTYKEISVQVSEQTPQGAISFYGPYISGYPDGTFRAEGPISRAEMATMIMRVLRLDVNEINQEYSKSYFSEATFSDVSDDNWAYVYIELAKEHGIMKGYRDKTFRPNESVSRAEMAVIVSNALDKFNVDQEESAKHFIKDVRFDHWAFNAINSLYNAGIVTGYNDGTFKPDEIIHRSEVVAIINKIISREGIDSDQPTFGDVSKDHWAYKLIEAATQIQIIRNDNN